MQNSKLSIITITKNNYKGLKDTIESVKIQNTKEFEFIIVDGNSIDNTKKLIEENRDIIDSFLIEDDAGIYDAMNKGIKIASGNYLLFLNAGDRFNAEDIISRFYSDLETSDYCCYYSNVRLFGKNDFIINCNHEKMRINHQALIYKRSLHDKYGLYLVMKGISASDYLFFNYLRNESWKKVEYIIACCDDTGISQRNFHYYQKYGIDLLFNNHSRTKVAIMLLIFPIYKHFRMIFYKISNKMKL